MRQRIWELDALRGLCVIGMVLVHLALDLGLSPGFFQEWGGAGFLLISGICVTLGRRHIRRGLLVLGCGMLCTGVTALMYLLGMGDRNMIIRFGILHCLGICMLLWALFSRLPQWGLGLLAPVLVFAGLWMDTVRVETPWLFPLGLRTVDFASGDYFPLVLNLGFFLLGSLLGRRLYREKRTLLPNVKPLRFLCFCGRHSLPIYLLHQPVLIGTLMLFG